MIISMNGIRISNLLYYSKNYSFINMIITTYCTKKATQMPTVLAWLEAINYCAYINAASESYQNYTKLFTFICQKREKFWFPFSSPPPKRKEKKLIKQRKLRQHKERLRN